MILAAPLVLSQARLDFGAAVLVASRRRRALADRRPDCHRKNERRRNAGDRNAERREQSARRDLGLDRREDHHRTWQQTRIAEMRGDLPGRKQTRSDTDALSRLIPLSLDRRTDRRRDPRPRRRAPYRQVSQRSIKDARIGGLLGNRPFWDAVEIARAIDFERRVVFEVSRALIGSRALRSCARISCTAATAAK